jgi:CubicO group peptidase (beta-lactamase class C family)
MSIDQATREQIDTILAPYDSTYTPGCAMAVVSAGEVLYARGYGMADLERSVVNTPDSVFDIGSTSKQFTAACVLLLARDGKLSLDDAVRTYIPSLPEYESPLTIRHLIHHTSGVRDYLNLMMFSGRRLENDYTEDEITALIARQTGLDFPPGTRFSYSNSGYFLMGEIVRAVSGQTLRQFAHERIFAPLGMTHTFFRDELQELIPDRAMAYEPAEGGGYRLDMPIIDIVGDGAVHTTVGDLARWDRQFYENDLPGGEGLIEDMQVQGVLNDGETLEYAAGLMIRSHRGARLIEHGGSWGGYRAEMLRFPEHRLGVIVLCNLSTMSPSSLALRIAETVLGDVLEALPEAVKEGKAAMPDMAPWMGTYVNAEATIALEIAQGDSGPVARAFGNAFPLEPAGPERVALDGTGIEVHLGPGDAISLSMGTPEPITLHRGGGGAAGAEALSSYAGRYYSPDLGVEYTIGLHGDGLRIRVALMPWNELIPVGDSIFTTDRGVLRFQNGDGSPTGFQLGSMRASKIDFERVTE